MGKERKKQEKKGKPKKRKTAGGRKKEGVVSLGDFQERGFTDTQPARVFGSLAELWKTYPEETWYVTGSRYWDETTADTVGMLGGLTELQEPDEKESHALLDMLQAAPYNVGRGRAADCGAGIGRVTQNVLSKHFGHVTLVEQEQRFVQVAMTAMPEIEGLCVGLQDWVPLAALDHPEAAFDCIWVQWIVGHFRDDHFVRFIRRAFDALAENGVLVIKDNMSTKENNGFVMDVKDHSITRSEAHYRHLFAVAGAKVVYFKKQTGFPPGMYPVPMWVLRDKKRQNTS